MAVNPAPIKHHVLYVSQVIMYQIKVALIVHWDVKSVILHLNVPLVSPNSS
jgi:hypothetical protein